MAAHSKNLEGGLGPTQELSSQTSHVQWFEEYLTYVAETMDLVLLQQGVKQLKKGIAYPWIY